MTVSPVAVAVPEAVTRLSRDLRAASSTLTEREARYLVDAYYTIQDHRIEAQGQVRAMTASEEPHDLLLWLFDQHGALEDDIRKALDAYSSAHIPGVWAKSITGIGPVIAAGLLAHIDIEKAPTVGHIWRFAGLDPTQEWGKGQKRPWNAPLKVLCWKIGESFVKQKGRDSDVYGKVYEARKAWETERNERHEYADQAASILERKKIGKTTDAYAAYSEGMLPKGHIHARAKRYATKLFLSHYHHVAYETAFGTPPPKPYIIEHGGHVHFLKPPNWSNGNVV